MIETPTSSEEFPEIVPYGWNQPLAEWWSENVGGIDAGANLRPGRVTRVDRGECDVATQLGVERVLSDSQRAQGDQAPAAGDWVAVGDDPSLGPAVALVMPRRTSIVRRDPGQVVINQVLVANVDLVAVVHGLDQPFSAARLERFLVLAHDSGADPMVVLTKADLTDSEPEKVAKQVKEITEATVVVTAAPEGFGIDELREAVAHQTVVFFGLSGCGKSTLTNALMGEEVQTTTEVRDTDARGRHTTTRRELFVVPGGGVLIDTPGIRSVGLWDAWAAVHAVYTEISEAAEGCRFGDCTHRNEPGCAVTAAVKAGGIKAARVQRYDSLIVELAELDEEITEHDRRQNRGGRPPR